MTSHIKQLQWAVERLAGKNRTMLKAVRDVFDALAAQNANNIEALLPIQAVDLHRTEIRWHEVSWEDVVLEGTWSYTDPDTGEYVEGLSRGELDRRIEAAEEARTGARGAKADKLDALLDAMLRAEEELPELMWNYSWRPYDDAVDIALANRIPQLVGVTYKGDKYFTLSSCGQDNGPAIMAYIALAHNVITPDHVRYLTPAHIQWTEYVIGRACLLEVAKALGVEKPVRRILAAEARRRRRAAKAIAELEAERKAIRDTPIPAPLLAELQKAYNANADTRWTDLLELFRDPLYRADMTKYAAAWEPVASRISAVPGVAEGTRTGSPCS